MDFSFNPFVAFGWSVLGGTFFVGTFGPVLGLPEAVSNLSPFANTPAARVSRDNR